MVIRRGHGEPQIFIPLFVIAAWDKAYGRNNLIATLPEVCKAIDAIDNFRQRKPLALNDMELAPNVMELVLKEIELRLGETARQFHNHISNKVFFESDFGRFVQAAVLNGHDISPIKYFKGVNVPWARKYPVRVTGVEVREEFHGRPLVWMRVSHWRMELDLIKSTDELLELLY